MGGAICEAALCRLKLMKPFDEVYNIQHIKKIYLLYNFLQFNFILSDKLNCSKHSALKFHINI